MPNIMPAEGEATPPEAALSDEDRTALRKAVRALEGSSYAGRLSRPAGRPSAASKVDRHMALGRESRLYRRRAGVSPPHPQQPRRGAGPPDPNGADAAS